MNENLATLVYPSDRYPMLIIRRTRATMTCRMANVDGLKPTGMSGGFPVYDHLLTQEQAISRAYGPEFKIYQTKRGWQYKSCAPVWIGEARYYRDCSD